MKPLYYMRDDHLFTKLSEDVEAAILQVLKDFCDGQDHGMLCTHRKGAPSHVHAEGTDKWDEFETKMREWFAEMPCA